MNSVRSQQVKTLAKTRLSPNIGWEAAIAEAEGLIRLARQRISILEGAIQVFRTRQAVGEVWPSSAKNEPIRGTTTVDAR